MHLRTFIAIAMAIPALSGQAAAQEAAPVDHSAHGGMPADGVAMPQPDHTQHGAPAQQDHAAHAAMEAVDHSAHLLHMTGALGAYAMTRDASGTAWQPESTPTEAIHGMYGAWATMLHGYINVAAADAGGPR